jgi:hypothetical protein
MTDPELPLAPLFAAPLEAIPLVVPLTLPVPLPAFWLPDVDPPLAPLPFCVSAGEPDEQATTATTGQTHNE